MGSGAQTRRSTAKDIRLAALAQVVGMGPHYFSEMFKQSTGTSPHRYIVEQKIERAKQYLQNPKVNVIEVSAVTGFADQSYFTKVFRRVVGVTPTEYRANFTDQPATPSTELNGERQTNGSAIAPGSRVS